MTTTNLSEGMDLVGREGTPAARKKQRVRAPAKRSDNIAGWLFISPAVLIIGLFGLFPIIYSAYMSLHRWRVRRGSFLWFDNYTEIVGDWVGALFFVAGMLTLLLTYFLWNSTFKKYRIDDTIVRLAITVVTLGFALLLITQGWGRMFEAGDEDFLDGLIFTFYYAFGTVPIQITLGLLLAYVLHKNIRGKQTFRMLFFLPYVTPQVAAAVVFRIVFSPRDTSLANQFVGVFGLEPQSWIQEPEPFLNAIFGLNLEGFLAGPSMALVTVILLGIWMYTGYNAVIFLAGMGTIPGDLYEAARVDGASEWHLFRHVTLPLLSPVTFYLTILGFIGTFKAFNTIYAMRDTAARGTTDTASIVVFDTFFRSNQFGYATAQAIVLFLIILALTSVQRTVFEKRVFYG